RAEPAVGIRPALDRRPLRRHEPADELPDPIDAFGGVRAAVGVHQPLEIREVGRLVGPDRSLQGRQLAICDGGRHVDRVHRVSLRVRPMGRSSARDPRNGAVSPIRACYPPRTVRLVETRLLEGPNVYRLEPVVKLEVAVGRRRTWYGQRDPGRHALVHLGAAVPVRDWPDPVAATVGWVRRLRVDHGEGRGGVAVHRSSDPGHWIVTFPWVGAERALTLTEAALALAERDVSSSRHAR